MLPVVLPLLETFFERVFWNGVQRTRRILFNCANVFKSPSFIAVFNWGTTKSHTEPCQGSRVVAEREECHYLPKIPGWNVLFVLVHCCKVAPRPRPPISVDSCDKQQVSDVLKRVDKTVGLQFGLVESTHNEQCPPYQRKQ